MLTVMLFVIAITLSSCSFFQSFTLESLIRPPKLTGENALIEQAFDSAVNADVVFISPISGDYRTAFVQFDLDADGTEETLVFYAKKDAPDEARLHLLKYDGEIWCSAGDIAGNGSEVYSVAFYHFDQDDSYEVAICWTVSDSRRNKTMSLYKLDENEEASGILPLSVVQLYDYLILDFDSDGQMELMYLMDNSADQEQPFKLSMIKMDVAEKAFHFVCELPLHRSVSLPSRMCYDNISRRYTLYIDCINADGSYMTEIIYYDTEEDVFSRIQNYEGVNLSDLTFRNAPMICTDINGDQLTEVPIQYTWEGSSVMYPEAENAVPMYVAEYAKLQDNDLLPLPVTYFYAPDASFRFRIDDFMDDYLAVYDAQDAILRFYYPDDMESPVFSVKYVAFASSESSFFVEITEPEMTNLTEKFILSFAEVL